MRRLIAPLAVAASFALSAGDASAELYRWTDGSGVAHYATDRSRIPVGADVQLVEPEDVRTGPALPLFGAPRATPSRADFGGPEPVAAPPDLSGVPDTGVPDTGVPDTPAPLGTRPPAPRPEPLDPQEAEIAEIEAQIHRDRETLKDLISTEQWDGSELLRDTRIREIAERLPRLEAELRALRGAAEE